MSRRSHAQAPCGRSSGRDSSDRRSDFAMRSGASSGTTRAERQAEPLPAPALRGTTQFGNAAAALRRSSLRDAAAGHDERRSLDSLQADTPGAFSCCRACHVILDVAHNRTRRARWRRICHHRASGRTSAVLACWDKDIAGAWRRLTAHRSLVHCRNSRAARRSAQLL